jgi:predicted nucleic acid-binding protein
VILVDTSVWIDHLHRGDVGLQRLLESAKVLSHPFVVGELAMGNLKRREAILEALQNLPAAEKAHDDEVLRFVSDHALFGLGIGYIDAHLLASVRLTPRASLWTKDKRLAEIALRLSLAAERPL